MIKKLRMKFVAVNMVIATVMLCVILGMVYSFTSGGLERESPMSRVYTAWKSIHRWLSCQGSSASLSQLSS